jgi:hypothetical protein
MPKSRISGRSSKIIYIAERKAKGVTESAPSKRCWFDCIDQILASIAKANNLPSGGRYGDISWKFTSKYRRSLTITLN